MPIPVHSGHVGGADNMAAAIIALQTWVGGITVNTAIDRQHFGLKLIEIQKRLVVLGKFSAGNVNLNIDDGALASKLRDAQNASNT